jgi:hypothetical protein
MLVFWVVTPCGLTGRYQRFEGTYCLDIQPLAHTAFFRVEDGGSIFLRNVGIYLQVHKVFLPRKPTSIQQKDER